MATQNRGEEMVVTMSCPTGYLFRNAMIWLLATTRVSSSNSSTVSVSARRSATIEPITPVTGVCWRWAM
jgi:hypothetical protein